MCPVLMSLFHISTSPTLRHLYPLHAPSQDMRLNKTARVQCDSKFSRCDLGLLVLTAIEIGTVQATTEVSLFSIVRSLVRNLVRGNTSDMLAVRTRRTAARNNEKCACGATAFG